VETRFEWDPAKARRNKRLHGVSFETATEVFSDPFIVTQVDILYEGEQRYQAIGRAKSETLLLVVFIDRSEPGNEIIRFISARKAERYEKNAYQDQFR
jgi:uncharacterized DUF497 family protein